MTGKMTVKMIPKTFSQHFPSWRRVCIVPPYLTFVVITTYTKLCVFQNVTAGSVNPAAIYVVSTIYNPTNNVVPIKYVNKISNHIYNPPINVCLQNLFYPFSLLAAIHLFISSYNEIEDFCSMDKLMQRDVKALTRAF